MRRFFRPIFRRPLPVFFVPTQLSRQILIRSEPIHTKKRIGRGVIPSKRQKQPSIGSRLVRKGQNSPLFWASPAGVATQYTMARTMEASALGLCCDNSRVPLVGRAGLSHYPRLVVNLLSGAMQTSVLVGLRRSICGVHGEACKSAAGSLHRPTEDFRNFDPPV